MREQDVKGSFYALQKENQIFLITGESSRYVDRCLLYLTTMMYPNAILGYLTSQEIFELLTFFSENKKVDFNTNKYVAKRMFGEQRVSNIRFESQEFTKTFEIVRKDRLWIDSISVISAKYDFSMSRKGIMQYSLGAFDEYYVLLQKWSEMCRSKYKRFEGRSRKDDPQKKVNPLIIKFDETMFDEEEIRKRFIKTIQEYPFCSYSIVHEGNPHIYLTLLDRIDNSSFSLRTYDSDSLLVMPQIKATKAALMRFSKHLIESLS